MNFQVFPGAKWKGSYLIKGLGRAQFGLNIRSPEQKQIVSLCYTHKPLERYQVILQAIFFFFKQNKNKTTECLKAFEKLNGSEPYMVPLFSSEGNMRVRPSFIHVFVYYVFRIVRVSV